MRRENQRTKAMRLAQTAWTRFGLRGQDVEALLRAGHTLQRWYEAECGADRPGGSVAIERDPETERPFSVFYPHTSNTVTRTAIPDREAAAKRQVERVLASYPGVRPFYQSDPRGAALYLYRPEDIPAGATVESCYSSFGLCLEV